MTPMTSTIAAYVVITVLMWGYAVYVFLALRRARKTEPAA